LADRTLRVAARVAGLLGRAGGDGPPRRFAVHRAPPEHVGLGTGTQLSLAVARALAELAGRGDVPIATLAALSGRGLRSGIGLHGFAGGGLIVDGGRRTEEGIPPCSAGLEFPGDWAVLVVLRRGPPACTAPARSGRSRGLPPLPAALTDRLCRLVLLGLLPAVVERDLARFGEALAELQHTSAASSPRRRGVPMPCPSWSRSSPGCGPRGSTASARVPGGRPSTASARTRPTGAPRSSAACKIGSASARRPPPGRGRARRARR
jgi:beta-RFAP synthase